MNFMNRRKQFLLNKLYVLLVFSSALAKDSVSLVIVTCPPNFSISTLSASKRSVSLIFKVCKPVK